MTTGDSRVFVPKEFPRYETILEAAHRYPAVDPSAVETFLTFLRVASDVQTALQAHYSRIHISQGRFVVLMLLNFNSDSEMGPCDLAQKLGVTRATITGLLDGLERDGFIKRLDNPEDRRRMTVILTPAGRRYLDRVLPDHFRRTAALMGALSVKERGELTRLLTKVAAGIPAVRNP
jgi:DNA-binding MarR family transcriptional regulator